METMRKEFITPDMAKKYLLSNAHNRNISLAIVEKYARDMKNGHWLLSDQGIGFDENGLMIDGQHRMMAVIKSGATIPCWVARGLPVKVNGVCTQDVIDTLKTRSTADQLTLSHGITNATTKASVANMIVSIIKNTNKISISATQALSVIDLYEDEMEFVLSDRGSGKGLSYSPVISGLVFAAKVELDSVIAFKDKYFKGTELSEGSPALTLRNYMMGRVSSYTQGYAQRRICFDYTTLSVWHHINNTKIKLLKLSPKGTEHFMNHQKGCVNKILAMFNGLDK